MINHTTLLCAALLVGGLTAQNPVSFQGGPGSVPAGATSATYDAYDLDSIFDPDDLLILGETCTLTADGWDTGVLELKCDDGEVCGGAGTSGEKEAEVYVIVTFRNSSGTVIGTATTSYKKVSC